MSPASPRAFTVASEPRGRIFSWHLGWVVLASTVALTVAGLHMIELATGDASRTLSSLTERQLFFMVVGLGAAALVCLVHYRFVAAFAWPLMILVIGLLVFVLVPFVPEAIVTPRNGSRRWINLGFTDFQPSEPAKIAYVLVTAGYLRYRSSYRTLMGLLPPALIAFVPIMLILVEPDLGTSLLFVPTFAAMLVAAGARMRHLIGATVIGLVLAIAVSAASLFFAHSGRYPLLRPHQVERIQAVMDRVKGDTRYESDRGFQGRQAMTLIGAGGVTGHTVDHSRALISYSGLPERHNDMIFAIVVNRFGLLGAAGIIGLYLVWIGASLAVAGACKDPFGRLIVVGLAAMQATQLTINISMNVGLFPITGMTLPYVSYGGSSLVTGFLMVGLIFNVAMRRRPYMWQRSFEYDGADDER